MAGANASRLAIERASVLSRATDESFLLPSRAVSMLVAVLNMPAPQASPPGGQGPDLLECSLHLLRRGARFLRNFMEWFRCSQIDMEQAGRFLAHRVFVGPPHAFVCEWQAEM